MNSFRIRVLRNGGLLLLAGCILPAHADNQTNVSTSSDYVCVNRSDNSRDWQKAVVQTNAAGFVTTNIHSYTEIANGLCHLVNGEYIDSLEKIDPVANGAQAVQGRYQVQWAANANTPSAVNLTMVDGKILSSSVYGLDYYDSSTGSNVLLAKIQDCTATISSNTLVYSNAFGSLADIQYVYRRAGLSQNIVICQPPPSPTEYGMNPDSTYLQVLTEFFSPPEPVITTVTNNGLPDDIRLDFGDMQMSVGQTFMLQGDTTTNAPGIPVMKNWTNLDDGKTFLIEGVPYSAISNLLSSLHSSTIKPDKSRVRRTVMLDPPPPRKGRAGTPLPAASPIDKPAAVHPVKVAQSPPKEAALVLDYELLSSTNNFTFQGNTTYLVSDLYNLLGTNYLESGSVIKYTNNTTAEIIVEDLECATREYGPAVLTSVNDNSVGETVGGSTGDPSSDYAGNIALSLNPSSGTTCLHDIRFNHLAVAIQEEPGNPQLNMTDFQILNCQFAFEGDKPQYNLYNGLIYNIRSEVFGPSPDYSDGISSFLGVNLTLHNCADYDGGIEMLSDLTNCLAVQVTNMESELDALIPGFSPITYTNATVILDTDPGVFQTIGAASHYLATNSPYAGAGTIDIDDATLSDLQTKTTYPPTNISGWITNDITFSPQVPRDTNGSAVDLGYHYDPVDLALNITVSNATVTVLPGTAMAVYGSNYGIWLYSSSTFNCTGTPMNPCWIVRYNTVQEQSNTNWANSSLGDSLSTSPVVFTSTDFANFRFTEWSVLAADGQIGLDNGGLVGVGALGSFQDCQFYGGSIYTFGCTLLSINCLYQRASIGLQYDNGNPDAFCNNLFLEGEFWYKHYSTDSAVWTFRDNLFDGTAISFSATSSNDLSSNNAYVTTNFGIVLPSNSIVVLTNSPAYEPGTLGDYYYPASQTNLIHTGSRSAAAAGLYHYAITPDNAIEGTNRVSIGFHHIATDSDGVPLDTSGDGLPDYVKDANGDGVFDSGDPVDWRNPFNIYDAGSSMSGWNPPNVRLEYWRFDNTNYASESGLIPTGKTNASLAAGWSGTALHLTNTNPSLVYPSTDSSWPTFNCTNGTLRFWFMPFYSTGASNGSAASGETFFDFGHGSDWVFGMPNGDYENHLRGASISNEAVCTFYDSTAALRLESNYWCQITVAFSPSNYAIYTNGILYATGNQPPQTNSISDYDVGDGIAFYPPTASQALGLWFGANAEGGGAPAQGLLDEVETFNYPLTPQAVAAGFPTSIGSTFTNVMVDSDYDGRSDFLENNVDGTNPTNAASVMQCRLGYWRFDSDFLIAEQGQIPLSHNDVSLEPSWSGMALNINSNPASQVTYWDVYTNGWANINCRQGCLRFWFKPNWNTHPTATAPFVYLGNTNPAVSQWSLNVNTSGEITFVTTSNSTSVTQLTATNLPFSSSHWMQIVLNYGTNGSALYTNGVLAVTNTNSVTLWPSLSDRNLGMVIGNDTAYTNSINGQFDEMETFNYQLAAADIATNFQIVQAVDSDLDGIPDLLEDIQLTNSRPFLPTPVVITGTIEAEQFDQGGNGVAYSTANTVTTSNYRPTRMFITNCDDLGKGYCLDQTRAGEWVNYSINVLVSQNYTIETRVAGIGTSGTFECEFTNAPSNTNTFYTNTGSLTITTNNWTNLSAHVYLPSGTNIMKLHFLSNGSDAAHVGRFNYISIYPWWQAGFTSTYTTNIPSSALSTNNDFDDAVNNAEAIQDVIDNLPSTGGIVQLPAGTYYVSQAAPDESEDCNHNAAISIVTTNVEIAGMGKTNTTIIAYNRATTVFLVGQGNAFPFPYVVAVTNFTLRDMTIKAQPHLAVANETNTTFELGQLYPPYPDITGELTVFRGATTNQIAENILITNCQFLFANVSIGITGFVSNCLITHCDINAWGGTNIYTGTTNNSPTNTSHTIGYNGSVGIFEGADPDYNVNILENNYNGNTNLGPSTNNPFGYVNTTEDEFLTADGFLYMQAGGNYFIARNTILNYGLEGIQIGGGPNSVVDNTYNTVISDAGCKALVVNHGSGPAANGTNAINYCTCFIGNSVYGGRYGAAPNGPPSMNCLNFSGNDFTLYPPFPTDYPGAMVFDQYFPQANVFGNTLESGGHGFVFGANCGNALIMDNNFANVTYRGIGAGVDGGTIQNTLIVNNILGEGATFHVQIPFTNSFNWFLGQNIYLNALTNSVPPFLDPISSAVHVN